MNSRLNRKAFTLVELLIVTGLMGALLGLILVGFRPNEDAQIRQAANILASALRNTQTLAMTSPQGAALVIVASNTGASTTSIWQGDVLPTILGSGSFSTPAPNSTYGSLSIFTLLNADGVGPGYQIRFSTSGTPGTGPWGPWLGFSSGTSLSGTASMQPELGQTLATAVLPSGTIPVSVSFEIAQRPMKSQSITFPKLAVIDTRWSSIGNDIDPNAQFVLSSASTSILTISSTTSPYRTSPLSLAQGSLASSADIAFCFDRTGALSSVVALPSVGMPAKSYAPFKPTAPIYFLVAGSAAVAASGTSAVPVVQSSSPIWVAIDPATGAVQTGKNQPTAIDLSVGGKADIARKIDTYFRTLRINVFPSPFFEAAK